jgi:hypothetical protein
MKKYPPEPVPQIQFPLGTVVIRHLHEDGYYRILQGNTHIFQFLIPGGGYVKFVFTHTDWQCQDFTIRGYFSKYPLSESINTTSAAIRWFSFPRVQQTMILKDRLFPVHAYDKHHFPHQKHKGDYPHFPFPHHLKDNPDFLYPAGTYYLNIQNMVAFENGYHLKFEMHDHLEPGNFPIAGSSALYTPPLSFP